MCTPCRPRSTGSDSTSCTSRRYEILHNERQARSFAAWAVYICSSATSRPPCRRDPAALAWISPNCSTHSTPAGSLRCPTVTDAARDDRAVRRSRSTHGRACRRAAARAPLRGDLLSGDAGVLARYTGEDTSALGTDARRRGRHRRPVGGQPAGATGSRIWACTGRRRAGVEVWRMLQASGQILQAGVLPLVRAGDRGLRGARHRHRDVDRDVDPGRRTRPDRTARGATDAVAAGGSKL